MLGARRILVGQAVCDPIDGAHRAILPPTSGATTSGNRGRAPADRLADTARPAALLGVTHVHGFSGSPIRRQLYSCPNDFEAVEADYRDFAERF